MQATVPVGINNIQKGSLNSQMVSRSITCGHHSEAVRTRKNFHPGPVFVGRGCQMTHTSQPSPHTLHQLPPGAR